MASTVVLSMLQMVPMEVTFMPASFICLMNSGMGAST